MKHEKNMDEKKSYNVLAVIAFIFAIVFPIVGLVLSIIALAIMKKDEKGNGLAIAGLIISITLIVIGLVLIIIGAMAFFGTLNIDKVSIQANQQVPTCDNNACSSEYSGNVSINILKDNGSQSGLDVNILVNSTP